ncbi:MAG TPA: HAD-IB family phosphatase [Candidatus Bathyarchaeia archaeon]
MPLSDYALVSFDVDGTIFRKAALTTAAPALGIGEKWNHYDDMEAHRRITKKECLDSQFKLLVGKHVDEVLREVSKVEVMRNIRETVEKLQGLRLGVVLLTDNPDFLCAYLVERFGFNGFIASKVRIEDGVITGEIQSLPDKLEGLKKYCKWLSIPLKKCVHVGDWDNDLPVFKSVGYSIALNAKTDKVKAAASYALQTDNLLDVYSHLTSLK